MQGNAQAVCNERQIVVAGEINTDSPDFGQLQPMVTAAERELASAGVAEAPARGRCRGGRRHREWVASALAVTFALVLCPLPTVSRASFPGNNGRLAFVDAVEIDVSVEEIHSVRPDGRGRRLLQGGAVNGEVTLAFSPRGGWIAYGSLFAEGPSGLRLFRADDSGQEKQLTHPATVGETIADDDQPAFAPDGRGIAFTRTYWHVSPPSSVVVERSELRIYRRGRTRLLLADARDPTWSIRKRIAFTRASSAGIWVVRPDGSGLRRILKRGRAPDWAPNGRQLVFTLGSRLMLARADGSRMRRLRRGSQPTFSPDGRRVAFINTKGQLATMRLDGGDSRRVASGQEGGPLSSPAWQSRPRR
jgi:hypothetical protein